MSGGKRSDLRRFYTALYHAFIHPSTFSDVDGQYVGMDGEVHTAEQFVKYADFSGWDVYRSQLPLFAMLFPDRASDFVQSLIADRQQSGWLPRWSVANGHTGVSPGDPADIAIASAYALGAREFDAQAALEAMVHGATEYGASPNGGLRRAAGPGRVSGSRLRAARAQRGVEHARAWRRGTGSPTRRRRARSSTRSPTSRSHGSRRRAATRRPTRRSRSARATGATSSTSARDGFSRDSRAGCLPPPGRRAPRGSPRATAPNTRGLRLRTWPA